MSRNTEFQFVSTDAAEITNFLITVYENLTGVSVRPASPEKLFAQWVASVIIQERVYNNYTANQNIPSRAEGKNLDALAELYYLQQRPQAKPAYCTERFTISEAQTFAILVPKGTRVTDASNTLIWETVADAYISAGDTYVDTAIRCQTDGTVGNGYAVGQLNVIVDVFDYYTSCTNITTSDDGSEIASDEEFYELMRESMFAFSTAGAVGSYIYHAKSVSTEIADVQAVRPAVVKKVTLDLYTFVRFGVICSVVALCHDLFVAVKADQPVSNAVAVARKGHVLPQKLALADGTLDLLHFFPPSVFQIIEAVPNVLHDDLLFLIDDQTRSFVAEFSAFEQEQVRGECFRFAVHVRGNLKIALINDVPCSLVASDLNAAAASIRHFTHRHRPSHSLLQSGLR